MGALRTASATRPALRRGKLCLYVSTDGRAEPAVFGETLRQGDGVGITDTDAIDLAFTANSEVLLFDVRMDVPRLWT